jgi:hypothetical protein
MLYYIRQTSDKRKVKFCLICRDATGCNDDKFYTVPKCTIRSKFVLKLKNVIRSNIKKHTVDYMYNRKQLRNETADFAELLFCYTLPCAATSRTCVYVLHPFPEITDRHR